MSSNQEKKPSEDADDGDVVQRAMGQLGPWQIVICVAISLCKVSIAWHQLAIIFLAPPQDFWCARPPGLSNMSEAWWRNVSSPPIPVNGRGSCERYKLSEDELAAGVTTPDTTPCVSWEFDTSLFTSTIAMDWYLVCQKEMLVYVAQTIFMSGILVGNFFFGVLSDRFGRKKPLMMSILLQVATGVATAFTNSFIMFCVFRFLDAFATGGFMLTTFVILMEIVGKKWRGYVAVMYHIPFAVGHFTLPGVSYLFRSWRHFQLAISLPSVLLLSYYWLVPESPRWLLSAGRVDEATEIITKAARRNNLPVNLVADLLAQRVQQKTDDKPKASFLDLFRYPNLRTKTLCIGFNWLVVGVCFFGLAQYMGTLAGNIFINVAAGGLIEIPGALFCMYATEKFGRRKTMMMSTLTAGLACFCVIFVPQGEGAAVWPLITFSTLGIVGMSVAFPTVYLYSGELFPTVVRNVGVGFASMCARVGSMAAPFISGLSPYGTFLPPLVFTIFPLIGCVLCYFLPETVNTNLPETIEDGENAGKKIKKKKDAAGIDNSNFQLEMEASKL